MDAPSNNWTDFRGRSNTMAPPPPRNAYLLGTVTSSSSESCHGSTNRMAPPPSRSLRLSSSCERHGFLKTASPTAPTPPIGNLREISPRSQQPSRRETSLSAPASTFRDNRVNILGEVSLPSRQVASRLRWSPPPIQSSMQQSSSQGYERRVGASTVSFACKRRNHSVHDDQYKRRRTHLDGPSYNCIDSREGKREEGHCGEIQYGHRGIVRHEHTNVAATEAERQTQQPCRYGGRCQYKESCRFSHQWDSFPKYQQQREQQQHAHYSGATIQEQNWRKQPCQHGNRCRYKWTCRFTHPSLSPMTNQLEQQREKQKEQQHEKGKQHPKEQEQKHQRKQQQQNQANEIKGQHQCSGTDIAAEPKNQNSCETARSRQQINIIDITSSHDSQEEKEHFTADSNIHDCHEGAAHYQQTDTIDITSSNENQEDGKTHIIFCIDFSGSMRRHDVKKRGNKKIISRWEAVFECADDFIAEQLKNNHNNDDSNTDEKDNNNNDDDNNGNCPSDGILVSLIIFNDTAKVLFKHISLFGDNGVLVRNKMKRICKNYKPKFGTQYGPALEKTKEVANNSSSGGTVMVLFLSDGRPADIPPGLLKLNKPIPPTYKYKKENYPSAGKMLNELQRDLGNRLSLQFICIYEEGKGWMKELARRYQGTFHMPQLSLDDTEKDATNNCDETSLLSDEEEAELQVIGAKSVKTLQRESHASASARGEIIDLAGTSLRSTFRTISSTLTTIRTSSVAAKQRMKERGVVLESMLGSGSIQSTTAKFEATRMVLHPTELKFIIPKDEKPNDKVVSIATHPFAQGGLRNVYRMTELPKPGFTRYSKYLVAKESRHVVQYTERLRFHQETSRCQARAVEFAHLFNDAAMEYNVQQPQINDKENATVILIPDVNFLDMDVYRLKDSNAPGGHRYLAVEQRLRGTYEKFNSNNGYVHRAIPFSEKEKDDKTKHIEVAQAYSHFTFEKSNASEMVVDIQGTAYTYTDPQLHSKDLSYGCADRGGRGIKDFFKTHVCNNYCKALKLSSKEL